MSVHWKKHLGMTCEDGKTRSVFIRGEFAPFVGWMATPDTAFSVAAFIYHKRKKLPGYVDETNTFRPLDSHAPLLGIRTSYDRTRYTRINAFSFSNVRAYRRGDEEEQRKISILYGPNPDVQMILRSAAPGWFNVKTWTPGFRMESNNMTRAETLKLWRRWKKHVMDSSPIKAAAHA